MEQQRILEHRLMNPNCDLCLTVNSQINSNFCYCGGDEILDGTRSKCENYIYYKGEWVWGIPFDERPKKERKKKRECGENYKEHLARKAERNLLLMWWRVKYGAEYPRRKLKKTIKFNIIKRVNEAPPPYTE